MSEVCEYPGCVAFAVADAQSRSVPRVSTKDDPVDARGLIQLSEGE